MAFWNKPFAEGIAISVANFLSAAGFAENGHVGGIAAEAPYVGAYPLERENNVEQPHIARIGVLLPANSA